MDIILKEILKSIYILPNREKDYFVQAFIEFYSSGIKYISGELQRFDIVERCVTDIFVFFSRELQNAIEKCKWQNLGDLYISFLRQSNDIYQIFSWKEITTVMRLCRALRKSGNGRSTNDIFEYSIHCFYKQNRDMFLKSCSSSCISLVIECYYYLKRHRAKGQDFIWNQFFFNRYIGVEDIAKRLLPHYETAFGYLICLICDDMVSSRKIWNDTPEDMCRVVKQYSDRLSIRTLDKIKEYGELIHNKDICFEVEKAISQNRNKKFKQQ